MVQSETSDPVARVMQQLKQYPPRIPNEAQARVLVDYYQSEMEKAQIILAMTQKLAESPDMDSNLALSEAKKEVAAEKKIRATWMIGFTENKEKTFAEFMAERQKDLEMQLEENQKKLEDTKSQLQLTDTYLTDKINEVDSLKTFCQSLISKYQVSEEKIRQNQYIVDDLKADIVEKEYLHQQKTVSKFEELEEKLEKVTKELSDYKLENNEKFDGLKERMDRNEKKEMMEENRRLKEEVADIYMRMRKVEEKNLKQNCQEVLKEAMERANELEHRNEELLKNLEDKNLEINNLREQVDDYVRTRGDEENLLRIISEKKKDLEKSKARTDELELRSDELLKNLEKKNTEIINLRQQLIESPDIGAVRSMNMELASLEEKLTAKDQEIIDLESMIQIELGIKNEEIEKYKKDIIDCETIIKCQRVDFEKKLKDANKSLELKEYEKEDLEKKLNARDYDIQILKEEVLELEEKLKIEKSGMEDMKREVVRRDYEIEDLEKEADEKDEKIRKLEADKSEVTRLAEELKKENAELKSKLSQANLKAQEVHFEMFCLKQEVEEQQKTNDVYLQEIDRLRRENGSLQR